MTPHHLAIAMEYAPGGDLSEYVDACKRAGVRSPCCTAMSVSAVAAPRACHGPAVLRTTHHDCRVQPQCAVQLGGVPETDARWFFQQFIIAVDYCHRLGIANRDIKVTAVRLGFGNAALCASELTCHPYRGTAA